MEYVQKFKVALLKATHHFIKYGENKSIENYGMVVSEEKKLRKLIDKITLYYGYKTGAKFREILDNEFHSSVRLGELMNSMKTHEKNYLIY